MALTIPPTWNPSLLHAFASLVLSITSLTLLSVAYSYIAADYKRFLALGPGGTPSTPMGYLRILILRRLTLPDVLRAPSVPTLFWLSNGYLTSLPLRRGTRPLVDGIAPHRQMTQKATQELFVALTESIAQIANEFPQESYVGRSTFEKHNTALFARYRTYTQPKYCGEIAHAHPSDGSMHMTLHPADIRLVIENGWGERHPLAREGGGWLYCWWRFWAPVPSGFAMVYAPRDEMELKIVMGIVRAAAWWVGGLDVKENGGGLRALN